MSDRIATRVAASLAVLNDYLTSLRGAAPASSDLLEHAYQGLSTFSLGGKHLRARLVHISAGDVQGDQLQAATVFGACVDMMHGAFLIHDDIIDRDDTRRGAPTVHAAVRDEFGNEHLGTSIAITTGDLGLNTAIGVLLDSPVDDTLVRQAMKILNAAAGQTIIGEILDIAHSVADQPDPDLVRLSNHLKTSDYSFSAPLKLGALAAGRDPAPMGPIGRELGRAYQAADDIAGTVGQSADTGKLAGGDVLHGRATLMTMRMDNGAEEDPMRLAEITADVVNEGQAHLEVARELIDKALLEPGIRDDLLTVTSTIEGMLRTYA
ncbi:geranylgeranyl pyrophosphate synthase [Corynebacterium humireducens NBRC 106098 = DSM 45392]|uniref:Geranylgeranyl pyrophosphate synthase n=1 Tax=Corynebacterium humireducens NBRC 106098 = DSM 45392 TaxID=1223515 RepID=A0A0B5CZP6_9CORY|nr:polyprenyl synthetase family protein [Corynebacterium humireducens]AJE31970.1 geranylgeranyl pyrophosphate synthase [Corynebacterium humireducens NBRC 106098 = DSM 45392]